MRDSIAGLLRELPAAKANEAFVVRPLATDSHYYAGRDAAGCAALLVKTTGQPRVPLRLAGIEARFAIQCAIAEPGAPETLETLTVILCLSRVPSVEGYFASILESLVSLLGPEPTVEGIGDTVDRLVELFQKLQQPARRSLTGLVGELCIILFAADAAVAVGAWRIDPDERFDFVAENLRLDVKASSRRRRFHEIAFEQANPPNEVCGLLASIWIEAAGGGCSLSSLSKSIEERLARDWRATFKLRTIIADTLGKNVIEAMQWSFDLELAKSSLLFFDANVVPAIRPALPAGVSAVRFMSDFSDAAPVVNERLITLLAPLALKLLPARAKQEPSPLNAPS